MPFEVKEVDLKTSTFTGYSAAMGNMDLGNDIIEPGAFETTIKERVPSRYIKLLDNHNSYSTSDVLGTVVAAEEVEWEGKGDNAPSHKLLTTFEVSQADPNAQVALQKVAERHLDQLSIGYRALKQEFEIMDEESSSGRETDPYWAWISGNGIRRIKEIQWWETSLVIWAMNPEAQVLANSVGSLLKFAQKAVQAGVEVPQDAVKETIEALQTLTGEKVPVDPGQEVRDAVASVRDALKLLEQASVPLDAVDRLNDLAKEFYVQHGDKDVGAAQFISWAVDNLEDTEEEEAKEEEPEVEATTEAEAEEKEVPPTEEPEVEEDEVVDTKDDEESVLVATVQSLVERMDKLAETLDAGTLGTEGITPDETPEETDGHVEDEEVAKDTDPEADGRHEHFPSGDELAVELLGLDILESELREPVPA